MGEGTDPTYKNITYSISMTFIHIKKIKHDHPDTGIREVYAVPSVAIATPQGRKLIPNPSGNEASLYPTLEEAEDAVRRAGFDYIFEGKKTYTLAQSAAQPTQISSDKPLEQAVPILIRQLQDRESSVVANSAFALGALRASAALEPLSNILGHDDANVRKHAAEAMARFGTPALPYLRDAFEAAKSSTRANAPYIRLTVMNAFLEMLQGGISSAQTEQLLPLALAALEDESWLVKAQAALVIGHAAKAMEEEKNQREPHKKRIER